MNGELSSGARGGFLLAVTQGNHKTTVEFLPNRGEKTQLLQELDLVLVSFMRGSDNSGRVFLSFQMLCESSLGAKVLNASFHGDQKVVAAFQETADRRTGKANGWFRTAESDGYILNINMERPIYWPGTRRIRTHESTYHSFGVYVTCYPGTSDSSATPPMSGKAGVTHNETAEKYGSQTSRPRLSPVADGPLGEAKQGMQPSTVPSLSRSISPREAPPQAVPATPTSDSLEGNQTIIGIKNILRPLVETVRSLEEKVKALGATPSARFDTDELTYELERWYERVARQRMQDLLSEGRVAKEALQGFPSAYSAVSEGEARRKLEEACPEFREAAAALQTVLSERKAESDTMLLSSAARVPLPHRGSVTSAAYVRFLMEQGLRNRQIPPVVQSKDAAYVQRVAHAYLDALDNLEVTAGRCGEIQEEWQRMMEKFKTPLQEHLQALGKVEKEIKAKDLSKSANTSGLVNDYLNSFLHHLNLRVMEVQRGYPLEPLKHRADSGCQGALGQIVEVVARGIEYRDSGKTYIHAVVRT